MNNGHLYVMINAVQDVKNPEVPNCYCEPAAISGYREYSQRGSGVRIYDVSL